MSLGEFSRRTAWPREPSELAALLKGAKQRGERLTDLSQSNPTLVGLADEDALAKLSDPEGAHYAPLPRGLLGARESVVRYHARRGHSLSAEHVFLTASTSESYGWLFKLLCDPGDVVLVPKPSYPLFPFLAQLDGVRLEHARRMRHDGWRLDMEAIERRLVAAGPAVRAIVLVNPSNPCGAYVHRDDAAKLISLAAEHRIALIVDEVFSDYPHAELSPSSRLSFAGEDGALCFVMNGLSKVALLPQLKLAWIACSGPDERRDEALSRLEIIADSYLSVGTPVQWALPSILDPVDSKQAGLRRRLAQNLDAIDAAIKQVGSSCPVRRVPTEGGWYAMIEVPRTRSDDEWIAHLLATERLVVHPGHFFDVEEQGVMVVSLILESEVFAEAIGRAVRCWSRG